MSDINHYTKDNVLQKLMNIIIQDAEIEQRKKNEFQRLYDEENEKKAFGKSVSYEHIRMASSDKEYKANEARVAELQIKENELAENSSKGLLDLTSM